MTTSILSDRLQNVLVVAPHADDETLGAGGAIARFVAEGRNVTVAVMTGRGSEPHPLFPDEAFADVQAEFGRAMSRLGVQRRIMADLPSTLLTEWPTHKINRAAQDVIEETLPDLVLLPFEHDLHKDHGLLNYAFRVALRPYLHNNRRPHLVLAYEVPSETHLQSPHLQASFDPHVWIDVSDHLEDKLEALACFASQMQPFPHPRSIEAVRALATWRGGQVGVRAAESFVMQRFVV